jgi:hypothetical protein
MDLFGRAARRKLPSAPRNSPGNVSIDKNGERFRIDIDCGNLQPGRRIWSEVFYIGKRASGEMPLIGQVFAENLPQPKDFTLTISVKASRSRMTLAELTSLPDPSGSDE